MDHTFQAQHVGSDDLGSVDEDITTFNSNVESLVGRRGQGCVREVGGV